MPCMVLLSKLVQPPPWMSGTAPRGAVAVPDGFVNIDWR
jgi:hypothetical protein